MGMERAVSSTFWLGCFDSGAGELDAAWRFSDAARSMGCSTAFFRSASSLLPICRLAARSAQSDFVIECAVSVAPGVTGFTAGCFVEASEASDGWLKLAAWIGSAGASGNFAENWI